MKMTKYSHSCVRFEKEGAVLVLDPGNFSEVDQALESADAILVTHEHADHIDRERVLPILAAAPNLHLYAPPVLAGSLRGDVAEDVRTRIHDVEPGTAFDIRGIAVRSFGFQHALIHPLVPVVENLAYLIEDGIYHPGDSFTVPHGLKARTLLVPIHAPWSKVGEVIDFVIACGAETAYPIHDALLNGNGRGVVEKHLERFGPMYGTQYVSLAAGESVEV
ncbi:MULTISPECIES: MBL fold metallo-hydrolase [Arthrobacter]|uniref:MBL fold metallo-hydrolase n=1 Tax=Arthrobacter caoxuetaonis TaxID=2886935 RepID=A0A9X1MCG8_9MICC|nr:MULTISPECIES: MBL fold metallo-hydrolase [Arthrobacter]MCC3280908.1 MBL fold metallo-hydrolase [Arthrobacter caoxuetaonis]MCC3296852.1 MBL fold metallo-hydrolase [Arthrobacter caoxuetaonis]MCC9192928.1 MBL fold metallo-hydrolase [Arthrobacter sp. zg-Y916]USQ56331.1 MBL fold metallo-hydrolase [Arthrobacter caoxuetaonis]